MARYLVDTTELPAETARCYVEVYDKYPRNENAQPLCSGYISATKDTLTQLCALLPLDKWDEVVSCKLKKFYSCTLIVGPWDIDNDTKTGATTYPDPAKRLKTKLANLRSYIYPTDPDAPQTQLVIVRR